MLKVQIFKKNNVDFFYTFIFHVIYSIYLFHQPNYLITQRANNLSFQF